MKTALKLYVVVKYHSLNDTDQNIPLLIIKFKKNALLLKYVFLLKATRAQFGHKNRKKQMSQKM